MNTNSWKPFVLLVDDDYVRMTALCEALRDECVIVWQRKPESAFSFVTHQLEISAIMIASDLQHGSEHASFVKRLASIFSGSIIGFSRSQEILKRLQVAGCTHLTADKKGLPDVVRDVLQREQLRLSA